jgi:hypothetical protein
MGNWQSSNSASAHHEAKAISKQAPAVNAEEVQQQAQKQALRDAINNQYTAMRETNDDIKGRIFAAYNEFNKDQSEANYKKLEKLETEAELQQKYITKTLTQYQIKDCPESLKCKLYLSSEGGHQVLTIEDYVKHFVALAKEMLEQTKKQELKQTKKEEKKGTHTNPDYDTPEKNKKKPKFIGSPGTPVSDGSPIKWGPGIFEKRKDDEARADIERQQLVEALIAKESAASNSDIVPMPDTTTDNESDGGYTYG